MHDVEGFLGWALLTLQWRVVQHFRLFSQNCFVPLSYQMIMKHQSPFAVSVFLSFLHSGIDTFGSLDFYIYYYWFGFIGYLSFCIVWLLFMCLWMFLLIVLHIFYRCIFHSYGLLLFVLWFILGLFSVLFSLDFCKCNDFCFACLFISCCFFSMVKYIWLFPLFCSFNDGNSKDWRTLFHWVSSLFLNHALGWESKEF